MADMISNALGLGGGSAPPPPPAEPAQFRQGTPLDPPAEESKGDVAGNNDNGFNTGETIEFIHYGHVHMDWSTNFPHGAALQDDGFPDLGNQKARAIYYRAALEREALLLHGFIGSCRAMLAEYTESKGSLGDIASIASAGMSLLGGGAPAASPPKPEDLDPFLDRVSVAGGQVNKDPIEFLDAHKAGIDLHQVRSEYEAYVNGSLAPQATKPDPASSLLPPLPEPVGTFQKYLFKAQEIYLQMYISVREKAEPAIADACHEISLNAIRERATPIFPVWFLAEKPQEEAAAKSDEDNLLKPVNDAIQDALAKIEQVKKDVEDFLGLTEAAKAPGDPYLSQAFSALEKDAPGALADSLAAVVPGVPGFLKTLVTEIAAANLRLLRASCTRMMVKPAEAISEDLLVEAGRHVITQRVLSLLPGADLLGGGGQGVTGVAGKFAGDKLTAFLDDNVTSQIDFIVEAASKGLAQQISDTKASLKPSAHTMEIYLARVPWWLAQMTRNVVFPIWNLILDLVFGSVTGLAGGAISGLESGFGSVKDAAQKGERAYDRISKVDNVGTDNLGDIQEFAKDPTGYLEDKLFGDGAGPAPPTKFPGGPRVSSGTGNQVPSGDGEIDTKWSKAKPAPVSAA